MPEVSLGSEILEEDLCSLKDCGVEEHACLTFRERPFMVHGKDAAVLEVGPGGGYTWHGIV